MKKSALVLALLLAVVIAALALPVFADEGEVTVVYGTPVVDAAVDDIWANAPGYKTLNSYGGAAVTSDTSSEWKFMWDENRFYVLIVVTDSQLNAQNATYWQNDCTQLFIDFEHSSDFANASYENFGAALGIRNCWEGGVLTPPDSFVVEALGQGFSFVEGDPEYDDFERAQKTTDTGYIIEYSFNPTLCWEDFKLEAGSQGGIDFCNDDSLEGSGQRDNLFVFSQKGDTWTNPHNLTTFTLAAKDAAVDIAAIQAAQDAKAAEEAAAAAAKQALIDNQLTDGVNVVYGTPAIDGDVDDVWANVPAYKAEYVYQDGEVKSVCEPSAKFMWDENKFYMLLEVKDDQLNAMTQTLWANDNLQFFIDFGHGHDFAANEYNGDGTAVGIRYCWLGGVVGLPEGFTVELLGGGGNITEGDERYDNIEKAQKTVDGGWVCEIAFAPTAFAPDFQMAEGAKGGLDYVIDDTNIGNDTGSRDTLYVFSIQSNTWSSSANLIPFTFVKEAEEAAAEAEAVETVEEAAEEVVEEAPAAEEAVEEIVVEEAEVAEEAEAPVEEAAPAAEEAAPQTFDFGVIAAIAAIVSLAGYGASRKH